MTDPTVVIGGGMSGMSAARHLANAGREVVLVEAAPSLGGLASGTELAGHPIETYYHYLIPGEPEILEVIDSLGIGDRVEWFPSTIGILRDGVIWPFTTPVDLLRFGPLGPMDRVRAGIGALRLGTVDDWESLDGITARAWLAGLTSDAVRDEVWDPLLRAKFGPAAAEVPAAWMWGRLQQRRGARKGTGEQLGYVRGGFRVLVDALEADLRALGVDIRVGCKVDEIEIEDGVVSGVFTSTGRIASNAVLYTGLLPRLSELVAPDHRDPRWSEAEGLGAICVLFDLPRALTDVFWTNVCDADVPFGGIIEHTNLLPTDWWGGRHVVYLSRYHTADEPIASQPTEAIVDEWFTACERLFDHFDRSMVGEVTVSRTDYAAPLVRAPYLPGLVSRTAPVGGLYLATMAQIYPQDRGMSEGIKRGTEVADVMLGGAESCPVCRHEGTRMRWPIETSGTEGGVNADAFRPSSSGYGGAVSSVVSCERCGHGFVLNAPTAPAVSDAYANAVDEVSLREETGQVATADRSLARIEETIAPGSVLDIGCWTGSFLVAARERGWDPIGVEPSAWASERATERGIEVVRGEFGTADAGKDFRMITACDVLEHLEHPGDLVEKAGGLLAPGGALYVTVPDAGSMLARVMGKRWWSVLPMHLQYFTEETLCRLVESAGFSVVWTGTHAKSFTATYYAERLASFIPALAPVPALVRRSSLADRLVAPDFRDRIELLALRQ